MTADARVVRNEAAVLGVGEEGDLAGDRFVDPRDAADVDAGIAFEAALETRRDVLEFQSVAASLLASRFSRALGTHGRMYRG